MPENLEELTHNEIIKCLILLNPNKSFDGYKLKQKLDALSTEYSRLKNLENSVENVLFFDFPFLAGDMTSSRYR
ncbi:hypothetical protein J4437_06300 [Candidatus Woesearchaeota archaeon]|nr:hypothetical protein [Candidatus Woesearchaeota archaeon]